MALFDETFEGWEKSDFSAFLQRKWASNRFNLERGRVRLRLIDLLGKVREQAGLDVDGLQIWTSPDHPKLSNGHKVQWQAAAFCRDASLRAAIEQTDPSLDADDVRSSHVHLGVVVEEEGVRVLLMLPAGAKLDQSRWDKGAAAWQAAAEALQVSIEKDASGTRIQWRITAESLLDGAASVAEIGAWLATALPALRAVQWLPYDDPDGVGAEVLAALQKAETTAANAKKPAPAAPSKPVTIAPAGSKTEEKKPPRKPYRPQPRRQSTRPAQPGRDGQQKPDRDGQQKPGRGGQQKHRRGGEQKTRRPEHRSDRRGPPGPRRPYELGPTRTEQKKTASDIVVGARVALKSGLFAGKEGEVMAIKKGQADVQVGMMKVSVALKDLSPA